MGARFSVPVQTGPDAHTASYKMGTGSFPGVKRPGRDVGHPPHLAPRLKKGCSIPPLPLGSSWPVLGSNLPIIVVVTFIIINYCN